ncbi:MAG: hypothetical protein FJX42_01655 [Alphaproteobacteria bacterium]|nr:hypothetical protein [Alphaproteobacteria bacterium]
MFKFLSKALLAVVLDKRARDALETEAAIAPPRAPANPKRPAAQASVPARPPVAPGEDKQALIRKALDMQRSKQHIFDGLSDDDKTKLYITAVKAMGIPPDQVERDLRRRTKNRPPEKG